MPKLHSRLLPRPKTTVFLLLNIYKSIYYLFLEAVPASNTLSEVFLDDGAWSKAQFSSNASESNNTGPKPVEVLKPAESNGQTVQTTSLNNGIETVDDKKALSGFFSFISKLI